MNFQIMIVRLFFILSLIIANYSLCGQIKFVRTNVNELPNSFKYKGQVISSIKWNDNLGVNYFLVTENDETEAGDEFKNITPYFYHYIATDTGYRLIWRFFDSHPGYLIHFINSAFNITDLDRNGTVEVWYMYKWLYTDSSCQSTKIVMNESNQLYKIRGEVDQKDEEYSFEAGFIEGNIMFRGFATKLWETMKNCK